MANDNTDTTGREIVIERLLNAPRELVFTVWTNPEHNTHWYGPRGYKTVTHSMDLRTGGSWTFVMHGPEGVDYENWIGYSEVTPPERLVFKHGSIVDDPDAFNVTITFGDRGDMTQLRMHMVFNTVEQCDMVKSFGAVELGNQTVDKLEEYLQQIS